jgi:hypothetical protein
MEAKNNYPKMCKSQMQLLQIQCNLILHPVPTCPHLIEKTVIIRGLATAGARAAHTLEARSALSACRRAGHHLVAAGAPRVAGEARRAGAHRQMVHHRAEGVGAAGGGGGAGIRALVVDAGEAGRAAGAGAAAQHAGHPLADLLAVAVVVQPGSKHIGDEGMLLQQD